MATMKGIPLSKVSPAFLHANSTSHTWVFSAFAEIIDNAYDPDVSASELLIDKVDIRGTPCLIFLDNGAGMDADHLLKMLSFGFCEKSIYEKQGSHQPIGHYGNGFKSGSMRIGNDALVFTRCPKSASIGLLSQTYLTSIQADCVMVPILEYRLPNLERIKSQESRNNLNAILEYSVFSSENELKEELKALEGSKTGTKIIICNLKKLQDSTYELDFASDPTDIRCPEAHEIDATSVYHRPIQQNVSEYKRSLREYCSILFLRPRMKITIRGVRVKSKLISKSLSNTEIDMYKPTWLSRPVKIIFGFACDSERPVDCDYGMMLYHRNRLIKAFEKVGYQRQPNDLGVGIVGVAQVDFLQPIHNKQDFNKDEKYNSVMTAFANKLNDYWNEKKGASNTEQTPVRNLPDWSWAQCEHCLKWRRLPDEIDPNSLPEQWFCRMNPDATHNRCDIPEEPEDEDLAVKPTYEKTFKKKLEERKRLQQLEREKEENLKRRKIMQKEQELEEKEAALRAIQQVAAAQPLQENRTVVSLQKALAEARRREEQQKRLILQIQEQKKAMEEQRNSLLQMAETLRTSDDMIPDEVFEQMSQLFSTLDPSFTTSTPMPSTPTKTENSKPMQNGKRNREVSIETETGEVLSVTENDIEIDVDEEFEGPSHSSTPAKNTEKPKTVKAESEKKPSKKQQNSTTVVSNSKTPAAKREKRSTSELVAEAVNAAAAVNSSKTPTTKRGKQTVVEIIAETETKKRKRQRKGPVVDVIDLTDESEFCEAVDVKPNLAECGTITLHGGQGPVVEVKQEKQAPDEILANENGHVEVTPKQEVCEPASQNPTTSPSKEKSGSANNDVTTSEATEEIHFSPPEDSEVVMDNCESLQDNLEMAIAAIQDRMEKEKCQEETCLTKSGDKDTVIKDEVGEESTKNNNDAVGGGKEIESGQSERVPDSSSSPGSEVPQEVDGTQRNRDDCEQDMDTENENTFPVLTLSDLLPAENNEVSNLANDSPAEGGGDYGGCSVDGDEGFNGFDAIDSETVEQDGLESSRYNTSGQQDDSEVVNPTEEPVSESCGSKQREKVDAGLSCGSVEAENGTECSADSSNKAASHADKLNDELDGNLMSSRDTLRDKSSPINSNNSYEDAGKVPEKNSEESPAVPAYTTDNSLTAKNSPKQVSNHSSSVDEDVSFGDESIRDHLHRKNKLISSSHSDQFSSTIQSQYAIEESVVLEKRTCVIDSNVDATTNHINHDVVKSNVDNKTIKSNVDNKTVYKKSDENHCKLKSMCDQYIQTDIDMETVKAVLTQHHSSSIKTSNHKSVQCTKELANIHSNDKSSQVLELSITSETQTDDTLSKTSQIDTEMLSSLKNEISLKTDLAEKMEARLQETYVNIHKLLGFIVPKAELGDISNIHQVVKDMVKYSEASTQQLDKGSSEVS
ncbi:hypothetical protein BsWGS_28195 [Bradybaena similaris]